ncbi:PAS domain-containing sensor histidine kinase [Chrysiogenes arsenatis]|uniref:PAS domain-containing sensor histidine kinase n=1 Tax=Chrysiogenes arsenatis TaxID=309797 RepID=UPI00041D777F|nr:PAS domain S-box protein [Chrysiogenes arsenatis]
MRKVPVPIDSLPDIVFCKDREGLYVECNKAFEALFGRTREEILGLRDNDFIPQTHADLFYTEDQSIIHEGCTIRSDSWIKTPDGNFVLFDVVKIPLRDASGAIIGVFGTGRDITDRESLRIKLEQSEQRLRQAHALAGMGHWEWNLVTNTCYWSEEYYEVIGHDTNKLVASCHSMTDITHPDDRKILDDFMSAVFSANPDPIFRLEYRIITATGAVRTISTQGEVIFDSYGTPSKICGVTRDISQVKASRKTIEQLKSALDNSSEAVLIHTGRGKFLYVNQAVADIYRYSVQDFLHRVRLWDLDPAITAENIDRVMQTVREQKAVHLELNNRRSNGEVFPAHIRVEQHFHDGEEFFLVIVRDLTEERQKQRAWEALIAKNTVLENMNDAIFIHEVDGRLLEVNQKTLEMYRIEFGDESYQRAITYDIAKDLSGPDNDLAGLTALWQRVINGEIARFEWQARRPLDGSLFYVEVILRKISLYNREVILANVRDITEQRELREQIISSLREKELMLKEIHHRVKNNMQVVSSLLNLQSYHARDNHEIVTILAECQERVRSMSLIHERLYRSENLSHIDFSEYIQSLAHGLFRSYVAAPRQIHFHTDVDAVPLDINTAIPLGLILNELISNALKHAFTLHQTGNLTVTLRSSAEQMALCVIDDGVGLPEGFDATSGGSLGLELVRTLALQLSGTFSLTHHAGGGSCAMVEFPFRKG